MSSAVNAGVNASSTALLTFGNAVSVISVALQFTSWTWTCVIAFHICHVLRTRIETNSLEEQGMERRYCVFVAGVMGCVFFPLLMYFNVGQSQHQHCWIKWWRKCQGWQG